VSSYGCSLASLSSPIPPPRRLLRPLLLPPPVCAGTRTRADGRVHSCTRVISRIIKVSRPPAVAGRSEGGRKVACFFLFSSGWCVRAHTHMRARARAHVHVPCTVRTRTHYGAVRSTLSMHTCGRARDFRPKYTREVLTRARVSERASERALPS